MRRLTARFREVSKPWVWGLDFSSRSEIWQAPQPQCCWDCCQISERWITERLWITDDQNSQRQESFNNTDHHGPLAASCQLVNTWVLGSILEVPLFTSDSYGSQRIIHTSRSELWHISKAKSSIKSCFGQNYECVYKVWCQTVALKSWYLNFYSILSDTPETTFG